MRKFLFSIFCATLSFLLALAPSAQAQSKSDAEALKKAKDAEEAAKKEAAKRAKEAEKAAKKAREQEEAARKAERQEAEQKARARDEALRRARAAAAAANKSDSKTAAKVSEPTEADRKAEQEARAASTVEGEKRSKAIEEARKAAEASREASKKAEAQEAARKAQELEDAAKHEASVRAAQEKEVSARAKETAEQLRKLNQQQETERKAKEAELARKAKAEKEAAKKAQAEEASRQARAEAEARKAKAAEEAAAREVAKEAARREKVQEAAARQQAREEAAQKAAAEEQARKAKAAEEAANEKIAKASARREEEASARAQAQEEAARKLEQTKTTARTAQPAKTTSSSDVAYDGETFRIVKVTKDGSASVVAPVADAPVAPNETATKAALAAEAKAKAQAEAESARQAKLENAARLAREEEARRLRTEADRKANEAEARAKRTEARPVIAVEPSSNPAVASEETFGSSANVARAPKTSMLPPPQPAPIAVPAALPPREEYTVEERTAAAQIRERRAASAEATPTYTSSTDLSGSSGRSRSASNQARYYEELWEKELAARGGKGKSSQPVIASAPDERRSQARYYEELWRKEQEAKHAKVATQSARTVRTGNEAASRVDAPLAVERSSEREVTTRTVQAQPQKEQKETIVPTHSTVSSERSTVGSKEAELKAEKARLTASIEANRKSPQTDTFQPVQLDATKTAKEERDAVARAEEEARKARAQEVSARKNLEETASKKAKAEREAMARAEEDAARKARAEDAARRSAEQEAAKRNREQPSAPAAVQVQAEPTEKQGFWARMRSSDKPKTEAPTVSSLLSDEERQAQDRALEALRQKQAELDAQDAQLKGGVAAPVVSAPSVQSQVSSAPRVDAAVPAISPEEAAKEARALAASNAELQSLKKKLATTSAEREKVTGDIAAAQKDLSTPGAKSGGKKFEVIVDNNDARLVGTWAEGKTGGFYGKDYSFKGKGTGANYADFTPNLPAAGNYEIFEWHVAGANRAADAPYIVNYDGGSQVVSVNQQLSGGKWNSIGTFAFAAGQNGSVRVTDGIGLQGQMIMADAIRFVLLDGTVNAAQTVDNSARERAIEALRIKQDALTSEEARLKNQVQAAEKRIAALEAGSAKRTAVSAQAPVTTVPTVAPVVPAVTSEADIQARASEAMRRREAELNAANAIKPKGKKLLSVKNAAEPVQVQEPARALTAKEQKLADLLRRYKADEITPRDYHQERAKILAEP